MHRIQTSSRANSGKSSPVHSTSTYDKKNVKQNKTTPFRNRNEQESQSAEKSSNIVSEVSSVETRSTNKNNGLFVEILPNFGNENRKPQSVLQNTKILAPCDFCDLVASVENRGNSDKLSKHNSLLGDIHSPQIDLSPTLLSPTAAFLLSFPVVSNTLTKSVEPISNYVESAHKAKQR